MDELQVQYNLSHLSLSWRADYPALEVPKKCSQNYTASTSLLAELHSREKYYTAKSKPNRQSTVTYTGRCEADGRAYGLFEEHTTIASHSRLPKCNYKPALLVVF